MKKIWVLAIFFAFCTAVALAGGDLCQLERTGGTISRLDSAAKLMVIKLSDSREMKIYWSDATRIEGTLKEGEKVRVQASFKDGKAWATSMHIVPVNRSSQAAGR
jgi:hypothetical protein